MSSLSERERTRRTKSGASDAIQPYALGARHLNAGWSPLPVKRDKRLYINGHYGHNGAMATPAEVREWCLEFGGANVALRLPDGSIGIDVDGYDGKAGFATIAEWEAECGPLLPTYVSTNRDDGSGIRFYRVPEGLEWPGNLGEKSGVDILCRADRFAVVAPSIHKSGRPYRWIGPDGVGLKDSAPAPDELTAQLPGAWVEALTESRRYDGGGGRDVDIKEALAWLVARGRRSAGDWPRAGGAEVEG